MPHPPATLALAAALLLAAPAAAEPPATALRNNSAIATLARLCHQITPAAHADLLERLRANHLAALGRTDDLAVARAYTIQTEGIQAARAGHPRADCRKVASAMPLVREAATLDTGWQPAD